MGRGAALGKPEVASALGATPLRLSEEAYQGKPTGVPQCAEQRSDRRAPFEAPRRHLDQARRGGPDAARAEAGGPGASVGGNGPGGNLSSRAQGSSHWTALTRQLI